MNFDFSDILIEVVKQKASDLHLTAGTPPMIRQKGALVPLEGMPKLTPTDTREIIYAILNSSQRQRLETDWQIDFAYSVPGHGRFRVNSYFQRGTLAAAFRLIPSETVPLEKLGMPPVIRTFAKKPRGLVLVTGPDGLGQVDDARLDHQRDQRDARRAHPHHRGPDRVPAQPQEVHRQPARAGGGRAVLRARPQGRAAPGPRRDPRRRDARHGDDRHGPDRGRDRPPRLRHAAHPGRAADRGPHHRRLPAGPAGSGARPAGHRPPGHRDPDPDPDRGRRRPLRRGRGARPDPGRAQPDPRGQDASDLLADPDGRPARHADDGRLARQPRPPGPDHHGRGRVRAPPSPPRCASSSSRSSWWPPDVGRHVHLQGRRRGRHAREGRDLRRLP